MRMTAAVALSLAIALAGPAAACGANKSTKVDSKQQTASTQTQKVDTTKKNGG